MLPLAVLQFVISTMHHALVVSPQGLLNWHFVDLGDAISTCAAMMTEHMRMA